jgi:hypothetical protein
MANLTLGSNHRFFQDLFLSKRQRKPKGQSRMDNLQTLTTMGTQDIGPRQAHKKLSHQNA